MIGIFIILFISWGLLYFFEKENLWVLGFKPFSKKLLQFISGFIITAMLCIIVQLLDAIIKSSEWVLNNNITIQNILQAGWSDLKSVVTELLIFCGALLYILIKRIGSKNGIFISAIAFGIYHWFSYSIIGNIVLMTTIFIGTGFSGYVWALAYSKTRSIMLPLGLHLGWNFTQNTIFSKGPLGDLILIKQGGVVLDGLISLLIFIIPLFCVPFIQLLYVLYFVRDESIINPE